MLVPVVEALEVGDFKQGRVLFLKVRDISLQTHFPSPESHPTMQLFIRLIPVGYHFLATPCYYQHTTILLVGIREYIWTGVWPALHCSFSSEAAANDGCIVSFRPIKTEEQA